MDDFMDLSDLNDRDRAGDWHDEGFDSPVLPSPGVGKKVTCRNCGKTGLTWGLSRSGRRWLVEPCGKLGHKCLNENEGRKTCRDVKV